MLWQQPEPMGTQAKSFVADGAKCHHLRHGFAQCWATTEEPMGCQDHHCSLPPCILGFCRGRSCISCCSCLPSSFWRCSIKLSSINVMPSSVSRGYNSFWFSSTIRQIGIVKREIHKFIKPSLPTTKAISCIGLVVVGNQMLSAPRRAAFVIWKREDLAVVKEMLTICTTGH